MAKKYAATRAAATKDKSKEECRESRSRSEGERKKEEGDRKGQNFHVNDMQRPPRQAWNKWSQEDDSTRYYKFHKRNGHSTMECRHLQEYLLGKYQRGEIKPPYSERARTEAENRRDDHRRTPPRREPARIEREIKSESHTGVKSPKRERPEERHEDNLPPPPRRRINIIMRVAPPAARIAIREQKGRPDDHDKKLKGKLRRRKKASGKDAKVKHVVIGKESIGSQDEKKTPPPNEKENIPQATGTEETPSSPAKQGQTQTAANINN
ncbi:hypothetical protein F2Q70_00039704 [Brassica cretica]|uniref:Uncharacterized protein n=1 Tax=Brassica cretica TaxID=69181 RepID=A0A8S9KB45_BRACR|nr:hypothetical protein F2Q70_00039704 [Brassica cretica]